MNLVFVTNLATTLFMVGVIWMVQLVHYPLFARVGVAAFPLYEVEHSRLISLIVVPAMLLELTTAVWFLFVRPSYVTQWEAWAGVALVGIIWGATFMLAVPQHALLRSGWNADAHRLLVSTNWLRTAVWSLRGLLVLWQVYKVLPT